MASRRFSCPEPGIILIIPMRTVEATHSVLVTSKLDSLFEVLSSLPLEGVEMLKVPITPQFFSLK